MPATADDAHRTLGPSELEALYTRLEKPVFNVVYRWLWDTEDARDVTQEAFVKLWNARSRVRMDSVEPLVFRTALNLAANRLRARKLKRFFSLEAAHGAVDPTPGAQEGLERLEQTKQVRAAVEALPEKLRLVVVLFELSGLSTQQIADTLGIPPGTVSSRRSLAMAALEKSLGPLEDAP